MSTDQQIAKLKRLRAGKKGSITKRIDQLSKLISECGSRTKIKYLLTALLEVQKAAKKLCNELSCLVEEPDVEWMEEVDHTVDTCVSEVQEYIDSRRDDAASSASITGSWIREHGPNLAGERNDLEYIGGITDGIADLSIHRNVASSNFFHDGNFDSNPVFSTAGMGGGVYNVFPYLPSTSCTQGTGYFAKPEELNGPYDIQYLAPQPNTSYASEMHRVTRQEHIEFDHDLDARQQPPSDFPRNFTNPIINQNPYASRSLRPVVSFSANQVDSWIDELNENRLNRYPDVTTGGITPDMTMAWMVQQSLPRVQIPSFDGSPVLWVEFITKFRDLIHNQGYLNDTQRSTYLLQHLDGEAKRSVRGFANDRRGYVLSLKRLKF